MEKKAEIGITLLTCSIFAYFLLIGITLWLRRFLVLLFARNISDFELYAIREGISIGVAMAGLVFYVAGRREFLNRSDEDQVMPNLRLILGFFLIGYSALMGLFGFGITQSQARKLFPYIRKSFMDLLIEISPILFLFALWIISGIVLIIDVLVIDTRKRISVWKPKDTRKFPD